MCHPAPRRNRAGMRECGRTGAGTGHPDALAAGSRLPTEGTQLGPVPACPSRGDPLLAAVPAAGDDGQVSVKAGE